MRAVQTGRDLKTLSDELQEHYGVTRRRAVFIARDQANKATAVINRARSKSWYTQAKWLHSGRRARTTANACRQFRQGLQHREGWLDPALGYRIWLARRSTAGA